MKCSQCLRYNILWTAFTFPMRDLFDLLAKPQENENTLSLWDTKDCNYSMKSAIYKSKIKKWFWLNWRILYATDCWTYFTYSLFFLWFISLLSTYLPPFLLPLETWKTSLLHDMNTWDVLQTIEGMINLCSQMWNKIEGQIKMK